MKIKIKFGTIKEAVEVSGLIPELNYSEYEEFTQRLKRKEYLILTASVNKVNVGFKAGYIEKNYFYSWIGGVIPEYRKMGVAKELANKQEQMVGKMGIDTIRFKTYNKFRNMLIFALKNDFSIIDTEDHYSEEKIKILLEKKLK